MPRWCNSPSLCPVPATERCPVKKGSCFRNERLRSKLLRLPHAHTILGVMCINFSTQQIRLSTAPHLIERFLHRTQREPRLPWLSLDQICSQMPKRLLEMLCSWCYRDSILPCHLECLKDAWWFLMWLFVDYMFYLKFRQSMPSECV